MPSLLTPRHNGNELWRLKVVSGYGITGKARFFGWLWNAGGARYGVGAFAGSFIPHMPLQLTHSRSLLVL